MTITVDPAEATLTRTAPASKLCVEAIALTISGLCPSITDPILEPYRQAVGGARLHETLPFNLKPDIPDDDTRLLVMSTLRTTIMMAVFYPGTASRPDLTMNMDAATGKLLEKGLNEMMAMCSMFWDACKCHKDMCELKMTYAELETLNNRVKSCMGGRPGFEMISPYRDHARFSPADAPCR